MKNSRAVLLCVSILSTLLAIGCGSGNFTPPPTGVTASSHPLVAQYSIRHFRQGMTAWVEFGTDTTYGRQTSVMASSPNTPDGQPLVILVAGMRAQTMYHMRAHVTLLDGSTWVDQDQTFTTGALPTSQPLPQIKISYPASGTLASVSPETGVELLSQQAPANSTLLQPMVTDLQGNVLWYCPLPALPIKPMPNGDYFVNLVSEIREVDLTCKTIRSISVLAVNQSLQTNGYPFVVTQGSSLGGFHHDMLALPNGHWIALGQTTKDFSDLPGYPGTTGVLGDVLLDIDPNGNVVWAWSAFDYLDVNRHLMGLPDWTHSNALVYTPDGNLLLSMRNQSWILKIDYANGTGSGNILWKLGEEGDFTLLGGDPSQWFYAQHYPNLLSTNGSQATLAIWDNGNQRLDSTGTIPCGAPPFAACYSRATMFQIDESTFVANLLWQDLPGFFSFWGGSIGVLDNGNVEFDMTDPFNTSASQIMEVTQTDNPQTVWQMNITGENAYRGYRIPSLYPGVAWQQ